MFYGYDVDVPPGGVLLYIQKPDIGLPAPSFNHPKPNIPLLSDSDWDIFHSTVQGIAKSMKDEKKIFHPLGHTWRFRNCFYPRSHRY